MIEKIPKFVVIELSDDLRTVLEQLCEDWRLDPSTAINPLCNTAICYDLDTLDLCEEYQGIINRAFAESLNRLLELKFKADQKHEYDLMRKLVLGGLQ